MKFSFIIMYHIRYINSFKELVITNKWAPAHSNNGVYWEFTNIYGHCLLDLLNWFHPIFYMGPHEKTFSYHYHPEEVYKKWKYHKMFDIV